MDGPGHCFLGGIMLVSIALFDGLNGDRERIKVVDQHQIGVVEDRDKGELVQDRDAGRAAAGTTAAGACPMNSHMPVTRVGFVRHVMRHLNYSVRSRGVHVNVNHALSDFLDDSGDRPEESRVSGEIGLCEGKNQRQYFAVLHGAIRSNRLDRLAIGVQTEEGDRLAQIILRPGISPDFHWLAAGNLAEHGHHAILFNHYIALPVSVAAPIGTVHAQELVPVVCDGLRHAANVRRQNGPDIMGQSKATVIDADSHLGHCSPPVSPPHKLARGVVQELQEIRARRAYAADSVQAGYFGFS